MNTIWIRVNERGHWTTHLFQREELYVSLRFRCLSLYRVQNHVLWWLLLHYHQEVVKDAHFCQRLSAKMINADNEDFLACFLMSGSTMSSFRHLAVISSVIVRETLSPHLILFLTSSSGQWGCWNGCFSSSSSSSFSSVDISSPSVAKSIFFANWVRFSDMDGGLEGVKQTMLMSCIKWAAVMIM